MTSSGSADARPLTRPRSAAPRSSRGRFKWALIGPRRHLAIHACGSRCVSLRMDTGASRACARRPRARRLRRLGAGRDGRWTVGRRSSRRRDRARRHDGGRGFGGSRDSRRGVLSVGRLRAWAGGVLLDGGSVAGRAVRVRARRDGADVWTEHHVRWSRGLHDRSVLHVLRAAGKVLRRVLARLRDRLYSARLSCGRRLSEHGAELLRALRARQLAQMYRGALHVNVRAWSAVTTDPHDGAVHRDGGAGREGREWLARAASALPSSQDTTSAPKTTAATNAAPDVTLRDPYAILHEAPFVLIPRASIRSAAELARRFSTLRGPAPRQRLDGKGAADRAERACERLGR